MLRENYMDSMEGKLEGGKILNYFLKNQTEKNMTIQFNNKSYTLGVLLLRNCENNLKIKITRENKVKFF